MKNRFFYVSILAMLALTSGLGAQESGPPPRPADQGFTQTLVMIAIALMFFYLILWRPEQKRRQEMEAQRDSLKKGDRVTAMGIVGTVSKVGEETVILKMVDGNKIEFLKTAISDVIEHPSSDKSAEEDSSSKRIPLPKGK